MNKQTVLALAISTVLLAAVSLPAEAAGPAKNVIFFLGDGMGPTTVTAARIFKYGEAGQLAMEKLPRTARIKTFSNNAQTTDSAPSMGAYTTGVKMNNEVIAMSSDTQAVAPSTDPTTSVSKSVNNCTISNGTSVPSILEQAIAANKATGVVTTARLTHATPAATYAHICHRDAEYQIAQQVVPGGAGYNPALATGINVLMGGISQYWIPFINNGSAIEKKGRPDMRNLIQEMKSAGYTFVTDKLTFDAAPTTANTKILALFDQNFANGHMSYELDRIKLNPVTEPSLSEMTAKSIDILSKNPNGYFLMVEGGRIDHALHGTNAKRALFDTIAFDDAIKTALGKVDLSNTLVVVTADHDHTMTINGYSNKGNPILDISRNYKDNGATNNHDKDGKTYTTLVFGNGPNRPATRSDVVSGTDSGQVLNDDYQQETGIKLSSETHGGGDVMLFATGAGANTFKGTLDNTKVFTLLKAALGL